jgi:hypothetical protein
MWGLKMERFSTPKVLAVGPNLREWWVGEKISHDNDVLRWLSNRIGSNPKKNEELLKPPR